MLFSTSLLSVLYIVVFDADIDNVASECEGMRDHTLKLNFAQYSNISHQANIKSRVEFKHNCERPLPPAAKQPSTFCGS